jgi:hypothetical protein
MILLSLSRFYIFYNTTLSQRTPKGLVSPFFRNYGRPFSNLFCSPCFLLEALCAPDLSSFSNTYVAHIQWSWNIRNAPSKSSVLTCLQLWLLRPSKLLVVARVRSESGDKETGGEIVLIYVLQCLVQQLVVCACAQNHHRRHITRTYLMNLQQR